MFMLKQKLKLKLMMLILLFMLMLMLLMMFMMMSRVESSLYAKKWRAQVGTGVKQKRNVNK